jgi:hypothetical protein
VNFEADVMDEVLARLVMRLRAKADTQAMDKEFVRKLAEPISPPKVEYLKNDLVDKLMAHHSSAYIKRMNQYIASENERLAKMPKYVPPTDVKALEAFEKVEKTIKPPKPVPSYGANLINVYTTKDKLNALDNYGDTITFEELITILRTTKYYIEHMVRIERLTAPHETISGWVWTKEQIKQFIEPTPANAKPFEDDLEIRQVTILL